MSKHLLGSILVGATALLLILAAGIYLTLPSSDVGSLNFEAGDLTVEIGKGVGTAKAPVVELDENGRAALAIPVSGTVLEDYPVLDLQFSSLPADASVYLVWQAEGRSMTHVSAPRSPGNRVSLSMSGQESWQGGARSVAILVAGQPGASWSVAWVTLKPGSLSTQLGVLLQEWLSFSPWDQRSINVNTGTRTPLALLLPVPVVFLLLTLSVAVYVVRGWMGSRAPSFQWRVVGGIALACWLGIDLMWQARLAWRVSDSVQRFGALDQKEKYHATDDAQLVAFARKVSALAGPSDSRVFVTSENDYLGMRLAYHIYPVNAYWRRRNATLPIEGSVQPGDYLVVLDDPLAIYDPTERMLVLAGEDRLPVSPVLDENADESLIAEFGRLYQVR